jgi:hypothetical protein
VKSRFSDGAEKSEQLPAGRIAAVWDGPFPPPGIDLDSVVHTELGANAVRRNWSGKDDNRER